MGEKCLEQLPSTPNKVEADPMVRLRLCIDVVSFLRTRIRPTFIEPDPCFCRYALNN